MKSGALEIDSNLVDSNDLVAHSRAGDIFHYRWAARRCLRLLQPKSSLEFIFIEGSDEPKKAGEYVIDISEYHNNSDGSKRIDYYQLKHSTVQKDKPFTLSGLKRTIEGFSERYKQHADDGTLSGVSFTIITNRKIAQSFRTNIEKVIKEGNASKPFTETLKECTKLNGKKLSEFCSLLNLEDGEGDYNVQKEELRIEMARLQPGIIDSSQLDSIVSIVQERVLPNSNGKIVKEDVLRPFGVTSERELFPAPPLFEKIDRLTTRKVYSELIDEINKSNQPLIIHAEGGVGKSVFSQYLIQSLPEGSLGISYDCFGSGKYRSRSEPRHKHRDALVQIANELAALGFCDPMLVNTTMQEDIIMRGFLSRIASTLKALKQANSTAKLFIIIDAADNAEMAASEFSDTCFANELLREEFPKDCHVILLCRPERIHLLKPSEGQPQIALSPFSEEETFENLKNWFPEASKDEGSEFHRLTNGNPRVQMNSISAGHTSVKELLSYLGPFGTTVEKQIELQLEAAVHKIKDATTLNYQDQVNKICTGLASLPPNIPIEVLAKASGVMVEDVKSFIADIGRSLWLLDSSVQFRDEPTETWFRKTFLATEDHFSQYIKVLEPLAAKLTYVAEVLPQLYLQAGMYGELIEMALSNQFLPEHNPIDKRNVLVYRLQFAFKAALRSQKYQDAIRLALRAGEEVAGDQRQQYLFQANTDILPLLQSKTKIQEIAFKRILRGGWEGSENVYTASLLSGIEEYKGEARGYLRSAMNWLKIHFEQVKKVNEHSRENKVRHEDIIEIAITSLNLFGPRACLKFLNRLKPKEHIFRDMKGLTTRLIDAGRFREIEGMLKYARRSKFYVVAIVSELVEVGRFPASEDLEKCLNTLTNSKLRIKKPSDPYHDNITLSIVAFLEACLHRGFNNNKIIQALDYYVPIQASSGVGGAYDSKERKIFLRALAIRNIISKKSVMDLDAMVPQLYKSDEKRRFGEEIKEFKEVVGSLIPWYDLRITLISGDNKRLINKAKKADSNSKKASAGRYRSYDILPKEIAEASSYVLVYASQVKKAAIKKFYETYLDNNSSFSIPHRINLLRAGNRSSHIDDLVPKLEYSAYNKVKGLNDVGPEEIAEHYIYLARSVLFKAPDDAAFYFEEAIDIVSKFGDEIVERWEAVVSLAKRAGGSTTDEIAYRFIRCGELVGSYVAREKHWDRSGAVVTCAKMSPQMAISTLSRWRDREIGHFEHQLESLLIYLVKSKAVPPSLGWSMTRLFSNHASETLLVACLANEPNELQKEKIFDDAFSLLRKEGVNSEYWGRLKSIADEYEINCEELNDIVSNTNIQLKSTVEKHSIVEKRAESKPKKEVERWNRIFNDVDILEPEGLRNLYQRFLNEFNDDEDYRPWRLRDLYSKALLQIKPHEIHDFIDRLLGFDKIPQYHLEHVLSSIPDTLKNKVSFKKKWPSVVYRFGIKYAHDLASSYSFRSVVKELSLEEALVDKLKEGVFYGLSQGQEFADASILFGFVRHTSTFINQDVASDLTEYALSRFELHIVDEFGDGPWASWLKVPQEINNSIAGLLWSALGSPRSEMRWRACHAVKKMADFECTSILESLLSWMVHDKVGAFGNNQFPFYYLHARQYLLIALSRISVDQPALLLPHKHIFLKYSKLEQHALIQKISTAIALNLEREISGTYSVSEKSNLERVGKAKQKVEGKKYEYEVDSYMHAKGLVDTTLDYYFGHDFNDYWFAPLGRVFGVSAKQINQLCANLIVKEWGLGSDWGYNKDPRVQLWDRSSDLETYYYKGDYPKTDTRDFYLAYHAMLVVAARLLENMPVVQSEDDEYEAEPWDYWLSKHQLTLEDYKWLSDCRGYLPLERPNWVYEEDKDTWRTEINDQDFLNGIQINDLEDWIVVKGGWTERDQTRSETYTVSSALVSRSTSEALLKALATCSNPRDYKLPDYEEDIMEINFGRFKLIGWVHNPYSSKGIDQFDPYGDGIDYPPFAPGEIFLEKLDLSQDSNGLIWYSAGNDQVLKCDAWSGAPDGYDEEPSQSGMQLSASLTLLKKLCQAYDCDLIIDVNISRDILYKYRSDDNKYEYRTHHKIYLYTADGRFKSIERNN
ncbi:hypothetical protein [Roseivirga pacifica]|uniref:hypothetical protein n=1 Tax=Roseivirga pacifica TaxID=1267423 RepID=UPI00227B56A9|nr:hypothetical protein [Roseivirga pacifica]